MAKGDKYQVETEESAQSDVAIKEVIASPPMFKVILINDDFTPMDFVISILKRHFNKDQASATEIMLKVHHEGRAICGIYTYEIAETKVAIVTEEARQQKYPLKCVLEA